MRYIRLTLGSLFFTSTVLFTGCNEVPDLDGVSSSTGDFIYKGHDFGADRDVEYKQGVKDGCKTSSGDYTKNHALFNGENNYHAGWEHGRLHCKGN